MRQAPSVLVVGALAAGLSACGTPPVTQRFLTDLTAISAPDHPYVGEVITYSGPLIDPKSYKAIPGSLFSEKCTVTTLAKSNGGSPEPATAQCLASASSATFFYVGYGLVDIPNQVLGMYQGARKAGVMTVQPANLCSGPAECPVQLFVTVAHL